MDDPGPGGHHWSPPPRPHPILAEALLGAEKLCCQPVVVLVATKYVLNLILHPARLLLLHLTVNRGPVLSLLRVEDNMAQLKFVTPFC